MGTRHRILGAGLVATLAASAGLLLASADKGMALPKKTGGTMSCTCACDSGATGITPDIVYSNSPVASCGELNGRTCNRERTVDGITTIVGGKLDFCNQTPGTSGAAAQIRRRVTVPQPTVTTKTKTK